jgi:hypothetical protein
MNFPMQNLIQNSLLLFSFIIFNIFPPFFFFFNCVCKFLYSSSVIPSFLF